MMLGGFLAFVSGAAMLAILFGTGIGKMDTGSFIFYTVWAVGLVIAGAASMQKSRR